MSTLWISIGRLRDHGSLAVESFVPSSLSSKLRRWILHVIVTHKSHQVDPCSCSGSQRPTPSRHCGLEAKGPESTGSALHKTALGSQTSRSHGKGSACLGMTNQTKSLLGEDEGLSLPPRLGHPPQNLRITFASRMETASVNLRLRPLSLARLRMYMPPWTDLPASRFLSWESFQCRGCPVFNPTPFYTTPSKHVVCRKKMPDQESLVR